MGIFQIISLFFALFMAYVVRIHYYRSILSLLEASAWYSLWFLFAVLAVFPDLLQGISDYLHFDRVFDFLIVGAFMVISVLVVRTYFKYREIKITLEKIIEEQAQQDIMSKLHKRNIYKKTLVVSS